jgi:hypothetical protein
MLRTGWLTGLEPVTPRSTISGQGVLSANLQEVTTTPESVCTSVCTNASKSANEAPSAGSTDGAIDDDLTTLVNAWPTLTNPVRAGIVAMVRAATAAE